MASARWKVGLVSHLCSQYLRAHRKNNYIRCSWLFPPPDIHCWGGKIWTYNISCIWYITQLSLLRGCTWEKSEKKVNQLYSPCLWKTTTENLNDTSVGQLHLINARLYLSSDSLLLQKIGYLSVTNNYVEDVPLTSLIKFRYPPSWRKCNFIGIDNTMTRLQV